MAVDSLDERRERVGLVTAVCVSAGRCASADRFPLGGGARLTRKRIESMTEVRLVLTEGGVRVARESEPADAHFLLGPGPTGGRCRVNLEPARTPRGPSATPRIARALAFLDREYDLDLTQAQT